MLRILLMSSLVSFSLLSPGKIALSASSTESNLENNTQFQKLEQPLGVKGIVTAVGFGLIGLELWWFKGGKTSAKSAEAKEGIQEVTIMVDGGYQPNRIVVNVDQPVRLNFDRRDSNSCLEEIQLPEFKIRKKLPLNQVTAVEFMPKTTGNYEFACGMNMFRGVIEVKQLS
ncbi:MAG: cupredoxin domain-containing protein [Microcoleaceae cyanobacterium]